MSAPTHHCCGCCVTRSDSPAPSTAAALVCVQPALFTSMGNQRDRVAHHQRSREEERDHHRGTVARARECAAELATDTWSALKGREALKVEWNAGANASLTSGEIRRRLTAQFAESGKMFTNRGDAAAALVSSTNVITADYELPCAHAGAVARGGSAPPRRHASSVLAVRTHSV